MLFTIEIDKGDYTMLFNPDKKHKMKNFIVEFLNNAGIREKKILSCNKNLKVKDIKKILNVRYSTENCKKIDITNIILMNIKDRKTIKLLTVVSSCFNKFLHRYISFFCGRCEGNGHHKGIINSFMQSLKKYDIKMIETFFEDTEHGFFHGLMASFICYVINEDGTLVEKKDSLEQIFISATMHDFLKANRVPQKEHDVKLKGFYPDLCEETYVHSNPPEKYFKKHLIIADRLELRRYPDYKTWVDDRFHTLYRKMKQEIKNMLDMFYTVYRPALEYIFKNRKSVFIRHGTEVHQENIEPFFPPPKTTYYEKCAKEYPIEIDTVPFCSVVNNKIIEGNKWFNDNQNGHCSNHDGNSQWNIIKGYISMEDFSSSGKILNSKTRDHLFANSNIKIDKWVFLYQNLEKSFNLNNATSEPSFLKSRMGIDPFDYITKLVEKNNRIVSQESVFLLFQFFRMFKCRIVVLR